MTLPAISRNRRTLPAWSMAAGIAMLFFGVVAYAKITDHWNTPVPAQVYLRLVPQANEQYHPLPGAER
jgi:hypothetical protein